MWHHGFKFIMVSLPLVWPTPVGLPERCGICMHQHSTSGIRRRRSRWCSTYWHMVQCEGVGWLLWWFAIMTKYSWNVTIRSEIWTTNIGSLGFQDIREWVILSRLILRSLGCFNLTPSKGQSKSPHIRHRMFNPIQHNLKERLYLVCWVWTYGFSMFVKLG